MQRRHMLAASLPFALAAPGVRAAEAFPNPPIRLVVANAAGGGPHVSSVLSAGTYCARIYDVGNLAAPTPFKVLIAHP